MNTSTPYYQTSLGYRDKLQGYGNQFTSAIGGALVTNKPSGLPYDGSIEAKQNKVLLWWNIAKAVLMFVLAVVAIGVGLNFKEPPFPITKTTSILEGTQRITDINTINIVPYAAAVPLAHALYALLMAILAKQFYHVFIEEKFNVARWIAYSLSQPFQIFVVIVVIGSSELESVIIFTVENFLSIGLLLLLEQNSRKAYTDRVAALIWCLVAAIVLVHFGIWGLILYNTYPDGVSVPFVIQALVIGVFVFISLIVIVNIINTALCYCNITYYYIYIEWIYQVLDVLNVLYFILVIVIGLTTVVIP